MAVLKKTIEMEMHYQNLIDGPPPRLGNLHMQAQANDGSTMDHWRETWKNNYKAAHERFGDFGPYSVGRLYATNRYLPALVVGSGPSLRESVPALRENRKLSHPLMAISCLHNYGYFEDEECHADYYLSLDSGKIVMDDVSEGRKQDADYYWETTKDKKLIATVASDPELFDKWQGEVYLFNSLLPDLEMRQYYDSIQPFHIYLSSGGNALGACLYAAKAIFCSDPIHLVGADCCFDYDGKFHSYKTHYDDPGQCVFWPSVFGIKRKTWPSYLNFKYWFDHVACTFPGRWINCSEGIIGSYLEGNIRQWTYMSLKDALVPYQLTDRVFLLPEGGEGEAKELPLSDVFSDPKRTENVIIF